jgi:hypothetical protein
MDIKQKIIDSIKWAQDNLNFTLVSDDWGTVNNKCTCAMGCVLLKNDPKDLVIIEYLRDTGRKAAEILGVSEVWVESFTDGFDGNGRSDTASEPKAFLLGAEIAAETFPIPYVDFLESLDDK